MVLALAKPATVPELAQSTGIEVRTLYRILRSLPDGVTLSVSESPRQGLGRPLRHYQVTQDVTKKETPALSPVLQDALRRATVALKDALGFARSIEPSAEEISRTVDLRSIRAAAARIAKNAVSVLTALARGDAALARAEIEGRRLAKTK